jgi:hypothetical protein
MGEQDEGTVWEKVGKSEGDQIEGRSGSRKDGRKDG